MDALFSLSKLRRKCQRGTCVLLVACILTILVIQVLYSAFLQGVIFPHPSAESFEIKNALSLALDQKYSGKDSVCQMPSQSSETNKMLNRLFYHRPSLEKCDEKQVSLCCAYLKPSKPRRSGNSFTQFIDCNLERCVDGNTTRVSFAFFDRFSGKKLQYNTRGLRKAKRLVTWLLHKAIRDHTPFIFVSCHKVKGNKRKYQPIMLMSSPTHCRVLLGSPLFSFSIQLAIGRRKLTKRFHGRVKMPNINIILVDSVSRNHIERSCPNTLAELKALRDSKNVKAFDFQLFHAIKARTYEVIHSLFAGEILRLGPKYDGTEIPPVPVGMGHMFSRFQATGYRTLYQDDVCYRYEWGLVRNLGILKECLQYPSKRYELFQQALKNHFVNEIGVSLLSCEILESHGLIHPYAFTGKLCYNGQFQHDYLLQHTLDRINFQKMALGSPLLMFTLLNVGHDDKGVRVQTLDLSLASYLRSLKNIDNTITLIMSDHGNTYGEYATTLEGKFEAFHPFLFLLFPSTMSHLMKASELENLHDNQFKLITVQEVHHGIMGILSRIKGSRRTLKGIFDFWPQNRSCTDIALSGNTLCFCQNWKLQVAPESMHFLLGEYVLQHLNAIVEKKQSGTHKSQLHCQQLHGSDVKNAWQASLKGEQIIGFDIVVQLKQIFSCLLSISHDDSHKYKLKILEVKRATIYSVFKQCADPKVELSLCICQTISKGNSDTKVSKSSIFEDLQYYPGNMIVSNFKVKTKVRPIDKKCIFLLTREYFAGTVVEIQNACLHRHYIVRPSFSFVNLKLIKGPREFIDIPPKVVKFIDILLATNIHIGWHWSYKVTFKWHQIL